MARIEVASDDVRAHSLHEEGQLTRQHTLVVAGTCDKMSAPDGPVDPVGGGRQPPPPDSHTRGDLARSRKKLRTTIFHFDALNEGRIKASEHYDVAMSQ